MKVGLNVTGLEVFYGGDLTGVFDVISRADEKGVDIVYCSDHLGFSGAAHAARRASHGFPFELEQPWYEPTLFLSAAAFQTRRIRLSTFVLVAPLRPALLLAKQLATLDVLSGGRVTVALGVGWQADEYRAAGMCFEGRFGDLEDQVEAMRALWGAAPASGRGRRFSFEDFHSYPLPVQGQGLPMLFGLGSIDEEPGPDRAPRPGLGDGAFRPAASACESAGAGVALRAAWPRPVRFRDPRRAVRRAGRRRLARPRRGPLSRQGRY
jgi:hypothetical protein